MFIRPCYRRTNGRRHAYWAMVESYRTERGPRQRTVAYLGQLDEAGRLGEDPGLRDNPGLRQHVTSQLASVQSVLDGLMVERPRRRIMRPAREA